MKTGDALTRNTWHRLAALQVVAFGVCLAYWYYQIEFSYVDATRMFDWVGHQSWPDMFDEILAGSAEFRPAHTFMVKTVHDLVGPSVVVFRTLQLALLSGIAMLFVALLRPRSEATWFGFTVGFGCLFGLHTARPVFISALPMGHGLLVVSVLFLATILLLRRRPSLALDGSALVLSLLAIFQYEAGVIVPVVWVVAGALHLGGARWRTAVGALLVLGLYATVRGLTNSDPLPGPFYTETGLLFQENVTVAELQERFAGREWLFHGYNILATLLTVPFSEPRAGVFFAVDALFNGAPVKPWQLVNWVTSAGSTVLIGWIAVGWWRSRDVEGRGLILIGVVVRSLNAALGYLYTRDRIPALAGVYYALLLGTAAGAAWRRRAEIRDTGRRMMLTAALVVLAIGWTHRGAGTVLWARDIAWSVKNEWTDRYDTLVAPSNDPVTRALQEEFRRRATQRVLPNPADDPQWMRDYFERKH